MNNEVVVFLPIRKGSKRVQNKNTRPFASYNYGLLELKLKQLANCTRAKKIIISSNDLDALKFCKKYKDIDSRIHTIQRPEYLCKDDTELTELVQYVPSITENPHILWTHVTSPFVGGKQYDKAIKAYLNALNNDFDSLMSVTKYQEFLWNKESNDLINRKDNDIRWPRTQDLKKLYEINSAIFIASRNIYTKEGDRIGKKPKLFLMNKIESLDIDWEEDFRLAEVIYESGNF